MPARYWLSSVDLVPNSSDNMFGTSMSVGQSMSEMPQADLDPGNCQKTLQGLPK